MLNRGYGKGKYRFNYLLIDGSFEYLIENHLICIEYIEKITKRKLINLYKKIIKSFNDSRTKLFVKLYFGNCMINSTELFKILPIYL